MKKTEYQIKDVAEIFNISADTVRYYDKIGLIHSIRKGDGNYRYFDLDVLGNLTSVMLLRSVGVSVEDIRTFFQDPVLPNLCDSLQKTQVSIQQEIDRLYKQRLALSELYANFRHVQSNYNEVMIRRSPKWWIVSVNDDFDPGKQNRAFQSILSQNEILPSFAFIMAKEDLIHGMDCYSEYCVLCEKDCEEIDYPVRQMEPCSCAYYVFYGNTRDRAAVLNAYQTVVNWIHLHNFTIAGDAIERYVLGTPTSALLEFWIPIN